VEIAATSCLNAQQNRKIANAYVGSLARIRNAAEDKLSAVRINWGGSRAANRCRDRRNPNEFTVPFRIYTFRDSVRHKVRAGRT
jgi:hypothetical protein